MECICNGKKLTVPSHDSKNQFSLYRMENVEVEDIRDENECIRTVGHSRYVFVFLFV